MISSIYCTVTAADLSQKTFISGFLINEYLNDIRKHFYPVSFINYV